MRGISLLITLMTATMLLWISTQVSTKPSNTASLQPSTQGNLQLTASEIVKQATLQTYAPQISLTSDATVQQFPNLELSASEVVKQATIQNPLPTQIVPPTNIPMSAAEIKNMGLHYLNQLTAEIGFSHPVFKSIVAEVIKADIEDSFWESDLKLQIARVNFSDSIWVMMVVKRHPYWLIGDYLYVFQLTDGNVVLVQNPMSNLDGYILGLGGYRFVQWNYETGYFDDKRDIDPKYKPFGFTDWNHNGLPDIAIFQGDTGNCCPFRLRLLELKGDGTAVDISPPSFDIVPYAFIDSHATGQMDIIGINGKAGASPNYYHWFGWNGTTYVDTSDQHAAFYEPQINRFKQRLIRESTCYDPRDFALDNVLYAYAAMHQFEKGWAKIEPLLKWDTCTAAQIEQYGYWIEGVKGEIKAHIF